MRRVHLRLGPRVPEAARSAPPQLARGRPSPATRAGCRRAGVRPTARSVRLGCRRGPARSRGAGRRTTRPRAGARGCGGTALRRRGPFRLELLTRAEAPRQRRRASGARLSEGRARVGRRRLDRRSPGRRASGLEALGRRRAARAVPRAVLRRPVAATTPARWRRPGRQVTRHPGRGRALMRVFGDLASERRMDELRRATTVRCVGLAEVRRQRERMHSRGACDHGQEAPVADAGPEPEGPSRRRLPSEFAHRPPLRAEGAREPRLPEGARPRAPRAPSRPTARGSPRPTAGASDGAGGRSSNVGHGARP